MGFIIVLPIAATIAILCKRKIEETIALSMFISIIIVYVSGLLSTFLPGIYVWETVAFFSTGYVIFSFIKRPEETRKYLISYGFAAYIFYAVYFYLVTKNRWLSGTDEYTHWALAVKNFVLYSDFSNISKSTDLNGTYVPAMAVWEYMSVRYMRYFSEWICMYAQDMLIIALILPGFKKITGNCSIIKFILLWVSYLLIPFTVHVGAVHTVQYGLLMVDTVLGFLSAYVIYMFYLTYLYRNRFYAVCMWTGSFILCLTKEYGTIMTIINIGIMIACVYKMQKKAITGLITRTAGTTALALITSLTSWYGYLSLYDRNSALMKAELIERFMHRKAMTYPLLHIYTLASIGHVGELFSALMGSGNYAGKSLKATVNAVVEQLSSTNYYYFGFWIHVSFSTFIVIMSIVYILHREYFHTGESSRDDLGNNLMRFSLLGCIPYLLVLSLAYYVLFQPWESIYLPSFDRYIYPCFISIIIVFLNVFIEEQGEKRICIYFIIFALLFAVCNPADIVTAMNRKPVATEFEGIDRRGEQFKNGDNIYFVDQNLQEDYHNLKQEFYYVTFPAISNGRFIGDDGSVTLTKDDGSRYSTGEWLEMLRSYNYIYLYKTDEMFSKKYAKMFDDVTIKNNQLYKIDWNNGKMQLREAGK